MRPDGLSARLLLLFTSFFQLLLSQNIFLYLLDSPFSARLGGIRRAADNLSLASCPAYSLPGVHRFGPAIDKPPEDKD